MLTEDFREFVALLNANDVEYLVVGGYAVGFHGHPRYTGDLDIWINPTERNADRLVSVVSEFGFGSFGLTREDFLEENNVIQLGYPPFRIDILTAIDGVSFAESYPQRSMIEVNGLTISVIGREALVRNKQASGRMRDKDDLENLQ